MCLSSLALKASSQQTLHKTHVYKKRQKLHILPEKRVSIISRLLTIIRWKSFKWKRQNENLSHIKRMRERIINGEKKGQTLLWTAELGKWGRFWKISKDCFCNDVWRWEIKSLTLRLPYKSRIFRSSLCCKKLSCFVKKALIKEFFHQWKKVERHFRKYCFSVARKLCNFLSFN